MGVDFCSHMCCVEFGDIIFSVIQGSKKYFFCLKVAKNAKKRYFCKIHAQYAKTIFVRQIFTFYVTHPVDLQWVVNISLITSI